MDQSEKSAYLSKLRNYQPPDGFSTRAKAKVTVENLRSGKGKLAPEERGKLNELDGLLAAAVLGQLVTDSEMTFGIVKPRASEGIGLPDSDDEAAQAIIAEIGVENVALIFHTLLDDDQTQKLYGKATFDRLRQTASERVGKSVAEVLLELTTSDPVTMMMVSRPDGGAVEWLKNKVGATRPSQAHPDSIRGRYARDAMMPNNLVHRSDTQEDTLREIAAFRLIVEDLIGFGDQKLFD